MSDSRNDINSKDVTPPVWAERLLSWYCRPELLEDLQGDLNEYFERNVKSKGVRKAKLIYVADVFKFFRHYTIRKPQFINLLINWIMLGSYIKTSGRSLVRNKLFSTINIIGLAISMSVGLVMISVLFDSFSYDKFHANHKRIYRLVSRYEYLGEKDNNFMATTSLKAGRLIEEDFSIPEGVVMFRRDFDGDVTANDKTIPLEGFWANESFFKVFSFELVQGNAATALKHPFSIVLTESSAVKLFGNIDPVGKAVIYREKQYTVTGILKDVPRFSHIKFGMLGSLSTRPSIIEKDDRSEMAWDNIWNTWTYLLLPDNADLISLKGSLHQMSLKQDTTVKNTHITLDLQPMDDIMTSNADYGNQVGPVLGGKMLWIFGGLSFVVILSACFNYTNLSVARSLRRTREIGIRKVIGAQRSQVLGQFIVEAIMISLFALLIALGLFVLIKPYFLSIEPSLQQLLTLEISPLLFVSFFAFALFVGITAGLLPALFFSRINAVQVLKSLSFKIGGKFALRKALIVFQYCISIIFISGTIVVYKQYRHFVAFDLGFSSENVINIHLQGTKANLIKKELSELPEVKSMSESVTVMGIGNYWGSRMKYNTNNPLDSASIHYNMVDENFIPLHGLKIIAGRNFIARAGEMKEDEVIVNEAALKRFNIAEQNPAKAIDEIVTIDRKDMRIIGVIKNFNYGRANDNINQREFVLRYSNDINQIVNVKIQSTDLLATHAKLEAVWKKVDPIHPFDGKIYGQQLEHAFEGLKATVKMAGFLATLAIVIASMGLLGMVVFTTETRVKEISIRKVMGATESRLMYLLGKGFIGLLGISILISLPLTIIFFEKILFPEMANHAPLSIFEMLLGVAGILLLALIMIASQTLKVSRSNPAEVLKNE